MAVEPHREISKKLPLQCGCNPTLGTRKIFVKVECSGGVPPPASFYVNAVLCLIIDISGRGPKSTACFFNILENKMMGGETQPLPGHQRAFCQGRGEVPSPANDEH